MADRPRVELHFGGPDRPPRALRDLLQDRVEAVPAGGRIAWATYYFRDLALADALIAASERGVDVRVRIEGRPRRADANEPVIARLAAHGLRGGLRVHLGRAPRKLPGFRKPSRPYLHAKIYVFQGLESSVLLGSFNPSGNVPEDPVVVADIGDQDRGHNLLAEFFDRHLASAFAAQVERIGSPALRWRPAQNHVLRSGAADFFLYPRLERKIIERHLRLSSDRASIVGAISHLKPGGLADALAALAARGGRVRLLVHDTERRVPEEIVAQLSAAGVAVERYEDPDRLPLHAKFVVIEDDGESTAYFGSFNFNRRSERSNHEVLVRSRDPGLVATLRKRFESMAEELKG